jgi:Leucine-rich repeat (LRR) protein
LIDLSIWYNEISEIIPGTFEIIISLESLHLNDNRIKHVDRDTFSGLLRLKYLYLSTNKLQFLHPDTFSGLPNLEHIDLYNNPGIHIPNDRNFIKSHSLLYLDISRCNISLVSVETFTNVSALNWLKLNLNKLRTVDINILRALPKLSTLYLYGNRLQCDCQLKEVWRWCEERNIRTVYWVTEPECDTPSEVEEMWWGC